MIDSYFIAFYPRSNDLIALISCNATMQSSFCETCPAMVTGKQKNHSKTQKNQPIRTKKGWGKTGAKNAKNRPFYVQ